MRKPLPLSALAQLFRQLANAQGAGLSLADTLAILGSDSDLPKAQLDLLAGLRESAEAGKPLSESLQAWPESFAAETVALVRAGEDADQLERVLDLLAGDCELRLTHGVSIKGALAWPAVIMTVLALVLAVIMIFVIPAFKQVFSSFGADLPTPTIVVMAMSDTFVQYWYWLIPLAGGIRFWVTRYGLSLPRLAGIDAMLMRLPFARAYLLKGFVARLTQALAVAAEAKTLLAPALAHQRATAGNLSLSELAGVLEAQIAAGKDIVAAVRATPHLPAQLAVALELGVRSNKLAAALGQVLAFSEAEAARTAMGLQQAILVCAYIATGLVVGGMVIALYLPIFKLGSIV